MRARSRALRVALVLIIAAASLAVALASASQQTWSSPATIASCGAATQPRVVFPLSYPTRRSGEGGILWLGPAVCPTGATGATGPTTVDIAGIHTDDQLASARTFAGSPASGVSLTSPLTALGTTKGQLVAIAGSSTQTAIASPEAVLGEGFAATGFDALGSLGGPADLVASANGFIGDADVADVVASASGGYAIALRAQRHSAGSFGRPIYLPAGSVAPTALALGMDFRADTIVVWAAGGEIWAQWVTNRDRVSAPQSIGPSGYAPQISTVLSDDDRAFIVWTDEPAPGTTGVTQVLVAHSAVGVIFHGASAIASFTEPADVRLTPGAVSIDRLSGEGLAMVWPTMVGGNYALEAAGVTSHNVLAPSLIAVSGEDVRLAAVASGPRDDLVVVVELAPRTSTGFDATAQQILATRAHVTKGPALGFAPLEQVAAAGMNSDVSVAIDPVTDCAVVAWQAVLAGVPVVQWAVCTSG